MADEIVYVADDGGGLQVINVRNPAQPRLLSSTPLPTTQPGGVAVAADVAYVAAEHAGFLVYDVAHPTQPTRIATIEDPEPNDDVERSFISRIELADGLAYVVERRRSRTTQQAKDYLTVIDVRTSTLPQRRGATPLRAQPLNSVTIRGLAVSGPFAYVARGSSGLEALDVRLPDGPRRVGFVKTSSEVRHVAAAGSFLYATVRVVGLEVIQGPGATVTDTDGDGITDFFDIFPTDPMETQDSDGDRIGDHADPDDDNDAFTDAEEVNAMPPTDPTDPQQYPFPLPPAGLATLTVDATTVVSVRERNGSPEAPYRAVTEALQVVRSGRVPDVHTIHVQPGRYAPLTTQETYPLYLGGLTGLTLQASDAGTVVLDADSQGRVISIEYSQDIVISGFEITNGATGIVVGDSSVTIQNNHIIANNGSGIWMYQLTDPGHFIQHKIQNNLVEGNGQYGIFNYGPSFATITQNIVRGNRSDGIEAAFDSHAEIRGNIVERNHRSGIAVTVGATGIVAQNIMRENDHYGLRITVDANAEVIDNTMMDNYGCGINVALGSRAVIRGGLITRTRAGLPPISFDPGHGVCMDGLDTRGGFNGPAHATIGLGSGAMMEISDNEGTGIFVEDDGYDSEAQIDSRNILFRNNAAGDTVGNVIDIAP